MSISRIMLALAVVSATPVAAATAPPPWARTEVRADCAAYDPLRSPLFGETHVHTAYSFDARIGDITNTPSHAYAFAKGAAVGLPPYDAMGHGLRTTQLRRPLDFVAVTDHAEQFGEVRICEAPGDPHYGEPECVQMRTLLGTAMPLPPPQQPPAVLTFAVPYTGLPPFHRFAWCGDGSCLAGASLVWNDTQAAAEAAYDRTNACTFSSFVAYEWTATPLGVNRHRNVIFRNGVVPPVPISTLEANTAPDLWNALKAQCLDGLPGCDVLAIPHNTNLSQGTMFSETYDAAGAAFRAAMEPLIEMTQHKGDSECHPLFSTNDEECGFEKMIRTTLADSSGNRTQFPMSYVRNILENGLQQEQAVGTNPFRLGFVGGTDSHNGTPGLVSEADYGPAGALGTRDATPAFMISPYPLGGIESQPGGLTVAWAEENSRDAIFSAMRRRETYATSGTRPIVRMFGGALGGVACGAPDFVERGYRGGVPMGGELGAVRGSHSPRFAVLATKDPGGNGDPGQPLQAVQIIKGWVDAAGQAHEQIYDVAGNRNNGASVDTTTCTPSGAGFDSLCTVWEDPQFNPDERAFYYARIIENPVCRWSTRVCNAQGIDCANPGSVPPDFATCCDAAFPKTIKERAWTSPIWYRPEAIGRVGGGIKFGTTPGGDTLALSLGLAQVPAEIDVRTKPLTITVSDDDQIYATTIPAGAMVERLPGRVFVWNANGAGGVRRAALRITRAGKGTLTLSTMPIDLSRAARVSHSVNVTVQIGTYEATHARLWVGNGARLWPRH